MPAAYVEEDQFPGVHQVVNEMAMNMRGMPAVRGRLLYEILTLQVGEGDLEDIDIQRASLVADMTSQIIASARMERDAEIDSLRAESENLKAVLREVHSILNSGAAAADAIKSGHCCVMLTSIKPDANKVQVIKVVREFTTLGLKEAKDLVDVVSNGIYQIVRVVGTREEGEVIVARFAEVGAEATTFVPPSSDSSLVPAVSPNTPTTTKKKRRR